MKILKNDINEHCSKEFYARFLLFFTIWIHSENRLWDVKDKFVNNIVNGRFYKHFITIKFLGITVFYTFWRTGKGMDNKINKGLFYVKD